MEADSIMPWRRRRRCHWTDRWFRFQMAVSLVCIHEVQVMLSCGVDKRRALTPHGEAVLSIMVGDSQVSILYCLLSVEEEVIDPVD